jgi:hypothetical protein
MRIGSGFPSLCMILPCQDSVFLLSFWLRLYRAVSIASLRFNRAPPNCAAPASGCRHKGTTSTSCNKLIVFCFDSCLPFANLYLSRFARRRQTRRAQALEANTSKVMKSTADSGGGIDESRTTSFLSRTRQENSTPSKERHHRPTRQSPNEMSEKSLR